MELYLPVKADLVSILQRASPLDDASQQHFRKKGWQNFSAGVMMGAVRVLDTILLQIQWV